MCSNCTEDGAAVALHGTHDLGQPGYLPVIPKARKAHRCVEFLVDGMCPPRMIMPKPGSCPFLVVGDGLIGEDALVRVPDPCRHVGAKPTRLEDGSCTAESVGAKEACCTWRSRLSLPELGFPVLITGYRRFRSNPPHLPAFQPRRRGIVRSIAVQNYSILKRAVSRLTIGIRTTQLVTRAGCRPAPRFPWSLAETPRIGRRRSPRAGPP